VKTLDPAKEQDYREEAERLSLLPCEEQRQILALHRSVAGNPKVPKQDCQVARERADDLRPAFAPSPTTGVRMNDTPTQRGNCRLSLVVYRSSVSGNRFAPLGAQFLQ
jgi:hypothetical protein